MVLEDLRVLQTAAEVADDIWEIVLQWDAFARDVVGKQITKSADSIGANIAEAFGRYHYGEKLSFLYYARGSLFETKYWLNRSQARGLIPSKETKQLANRLSGLARQLNAFAATVKQNRHKKNPSSIGETRGEYVVNELPALLFEQDALAWLESSDPSKSHQY